MVIISSFYNEEYLLPWWLRHHKNYFEHGILFNYFSTDKSVEIIKKICPNWEIRNTKNKDWNFADNDREWMEVERKFTGYKLILTTTEFLMGIPKLPTKPTAFAIPTIRMVDNEPNKKPTYGKSLVEQKHFGFVDKSANKYRFLHSYPDGRYGIGRHSTEHKVIKSSKWIYKYVFSPWTEEFIQRKLQMKKYMSVEDKEQKRGRHHAWDRRKLEKEYKKVLLLGKCKNYQFNRTYHE